MLKKPRLETPGARTGASFEESYVSVSSHGGGELLCEDEGRERLVLPDPQLTASPSCHCFLTPANTRTRLFLSAINSSWLLCVFPSEFYPYPSLCGLCDCYYCAFLA